MLLFRYTFYNTYVSNQIRQVLAYTLDKIFNKFPTFQGKKDRIVFLSGDYAIFSRNTQELLEHLKTPYILIYNENINETYPLQYHANFHAYGFRKKIFFNHKIESTNDPLLKTNIKDFYIFLRHNRITYTVTMSIVASSYDELMDIMTSFTSLVVLNRYYLHHVPIQVYIPREIRLYNQNIQYIFDLAISSNILKEEKFKLIDKNSIIYNETIPVYIKLDSIQNNPLPLFDTNDHVYKSEVSMTVDMPIIKIIEFEGIIPILGINLQVNIVPPNFTISNTVITEYKTYILEEKIINDNQTTVTFDISLPNNEQLLQNTVIAVLERNMQPKNENVLNIISLYLYPRINNINNNNWKITVNYNYKAGDIVRLKYETKLTQ